MNDRPTLLQLLDAVREHLDEQIVPAVKGDARLYFQTLVASNILKIAAREIAVRPAHVRAEWGRLNVLLGTDDALPTGMFAADAQLAQKVDALCTAIRAGDYDDPPRRRALFEHVLETARESLEIANPKLLATMDEEVGAI
jgi:hypothetical protein